MAVLSDDLADRLIDQYLQTWSGQQKLIASLVDAAQRETENLRMGREPSEVVIKRIREVSARLDNKLTFAMSGGLPPVVRQALDEMESAWHDYQSLPRPGRYRTLVKD